MRTTWSSYSLPATSPDFSDLSFSINGHGLQRTSPTDEGRCRVYSDFDLL